MPAYRAPSRMLLAVAILVVAIGCSEQSTPPGPAAPRAGTSGATVAKVCDVTAKLMNVDRAKVTEKTSLADLGADDLDFVELVMELEDQFDVTISDEAATGLMGKKEGDEGMKNVTMAKLAGLVDNLKK